MWIRINYANICKLYKYIQIMLVYLEYVCIFYKLPTSLTISISCASFRTSSSFKGWKIFRQQQSRLGFYILNDRKFNGFRFPTIKIVVAFRIVLL